MPDKRGVGTSRRARVSARVFYVGRPSGGYAPMRRRIPSRHFLLRFRMPNIIYFNFSKRKMINAINFYCYKNSFVGIFIIFFVSYMYMRNKREKMYICTICKLQDNCKYCLQLYIYLFSGTLITLQSALFEYKKKGSDTLVTLRDNFQCTRDAKNRAFKAF